MDAFWFSVAKYGFDLVALVVVITGVWKFFDKRLWPWIERQAEKSQERLEATQKRMDEMSQEFLKDLRHQREDFISALESQQRHNRDVADAQRSLLAEILIIVKGLKP